MKKTKTVLEANEKEAGQRVLDNLWDDERQVFESAPSENHNFQDLKTISQGLNREECGRPAVMRRRIDGGRLVVTPGFLARVHPADLHLALGRHFSGDWGEVCDEDRNANEEALREGSRLFSVYSDDNGERFWIITEADRSSTCVLLPEEY